MSFATMSTAVINETAPIISLKAVSVAWVKIVKLIIKVDPEAIKRQLIAFNMLLEGLSLSISWCLILSINEICFNPQVYEIFNELWINCWSKKKVNF